MPPRDTHAHDGAGSADAAGKRPRGHRVLVVLGRVLLVLVALLVLTLVLEVGSRWVTRSSPVRMEFALDRRLAPYTMFGAGRLQKDLNALGYRGPVAAMPKPASEFRIVVIGASVVVLGDPPIPVLLQDELARLGFPDVRVYNYGVVAGSSGMDLARLVYEVSDRDPDLVIFYNGANDLTTPFLFDPRPGYPLNFIVYEHNPLLRADLGTYPAFALAAYGSNLARLLFPDYFSRTFVPIQQVRRDAGWGTEPWKRKILDIYLGNLNKAAVVARGLGVEMATFVQPLVYFKEPSPEERAFIDGMEVNVAAQGLSDFAGYTRDMRRRLVERLDARSDADAVRIFDLMSLFAGSAGQVFTDFVHTTQPAMQTVASEMARTLLATPAYRERLERRRP